jgi:hypothetical protein
MLVDEECNDVIGAGKIKKAKRTYPLARFSDCNLKFGSCQ